LIGVRLELDPANAPVELEGAMRYTGLAAGEGANDGADTTPPGALLEWGGGVAVGVGGFIRGRGIGEMGPGPGVDWGRIVLEAGVWGGLVGPGADGRLLIY